jgi:hypothetical protein
MTKKLLAATMLLGISGTVLVSNRDVLGSAPAACKVQGVWERTATIQKGKRTEFAGGKQYKLVTRTHYTWLYAATRRDTLPLRTSLDSASFYSMSGGYGTYKVSGHKYTEQLDVFVDPRLEGKSLAASCQVEGNQWIHTYRESDLGTPTPGTTASPDSTTEIWRRVE